MKRGIKQKSRSPQKPRPPAPSKPKGYQVNWKDHTLQDYSPHTQNPLLSLNGSAATKSDFLASLESYSTKIFNRMSKESDIISERVCRALQEILLKEMLEIEVISHLKRAALYSQRYEGTKQQDGTKPTLKSHLVNTQLLQVSYDIDAKQEEQLAFSFGNQEAIPQNHKNILQDQQQNPQLSSLKRSPKEHKASESSLNTDVLSRSHKADRLISPKNPERKLQKLLPQLSPYSNIAIRKSKTELKQNITQLEAKISIRPSSNRSPQRKLQTTTKLPLQKQLSFKSKRVPLTLVDLLVEESQSRIEDSQEEEQRRVKPARPHYLLRSLGKEQLAQLDSRRNNPYESRNKYNLGGAYTQGSQGAQASSSQRANSIERNRRLSQREVRSEQKFQIAQKTHVSTRTNYQKSSNKLRKQLLHNKSHQKHIILSEESNVYANMTEPDRSRNRETPQSELSKETQGAGGGDLSPRIDVWKQVEFKRSDKMVTSPLRYKKRILEGSHLSSIGDAVNKSQTIRINSKYTRYGRYDKFRDRPQIQTLSQTRHQGKLGSMELEVYEGLESYLPIPKKPNPRSDKRLTTGPRSPQPSFSSSKRSPSQCKFSNTSYIMKSPAIRDTFYNAGDFRRKVLFEKSMHSKGSAERMKMLIFPWEYAELSKRNKESTSLTKEFSQKGNTSVIYSTASRAPKPKQNSVYKTICPQPSLARSQFLNH